MSGGCCGGPSSGYPDPNRRFGIAGAGDVNVHRRDLQPQRRRFYSPRLYRISEVIQNPTSISLREFGILVFVLFALYRGYFAADELYDLLARQDVGVFCRGATAMQCLVFHLLDCLQIVWDWAIGTVPWGLVGVVVVFFGEELLRAVKRR